MGFFSKKPKTNDLAEEVRKQAYMEERIRQAKNVGIAQARAEAKTARRQPSSGVKTGGKGVFAGVASFLGSPQVQQASKNSMAFMSNGFSGPTPKRGRKNAADRDDQWGGMF